ncbi:MAG: ATP synthase F1 subunit delta [Thermogutta sp.]|uniref:ATP synthase F1 subunit delta n=1 Tax=Thermogutta sp. TaxID=1962930 RepID=UPI0019ADF15C|nr:ATP synthase F1 subunit delta [Thermogutta sp.]MBC7352943.1 ATP synthase F1 subunit delta [Thermogutta sp.]
MAQDLEARDARFAAEFAGDVTVEKIASVYAEAFLNAAEKTGQVEELVAELRAIEEEVLKPFPRFAELLGSGIINHEEKLEILNRVFEARVSPLVMNFLRVLNRRDRLDILGPIVQAIQEEWDRRRGLVHLKVITATPLEKDLMERLEGQLRELVGGVPVVQWQVDPGVIGGIVIQVGDKILDASVETQLRKIRQQIIDRSAHEIQSRRDRFCDPAGD